MAGLDELFPDAAERPGVVLPAAPHDEPAGSRRLGIVALILGAFALVSELGGLLTGIAVFASILGSLGVGIGTDGLDWVVGYEWGSAIAGLLLGIGAVLIGVLAARRRRGRRFGVAGAILGGVALVFELVLGVLLAVLMSG